MKSRSEIIAERNAAKKNIEEEKPKSSSKTLHCDDCDKDYPIGDLAKREDGDYECAGCAMPLKVGGTKVEKKDDAVSRVIDKKKNGAAATVQTRTGGFCGKCGAEWPLMNGKYIQNCGHGDALRVDDPRKATNVKASTASGVTQMPSEPPSSHTIPPNVKMTVEGNRITMAWGKVIFPVGEAQGVSKFSNMDIGPFSISETFEPSTFIETVRRMLANLQQIADMTFDTQFVWYKEKLGLLDK